MKHPGPALTALHAFERQKLGKSPWEHAAKKYDTMLWKVLAYTVAAAALVFLITSAFDLSATMVIARQIALIACMLSGIALMLFDIATGVYGMTRAKDDLLSALLSQVDHDLKRVGVLAAYDTETLESARIFLQLKCARMRNRMGLLLGGPDKATLSSLVALGVLCYQFIYKELGLKLLADFMHGLIGFPLVFIVLVAAICGAAIGAVVMNFQLHRYLYQLELIELALKGRA